MCMLKGLYFVIFLAFYKYMEKYVYVCIYLMSNVRVTVIYIQHTLSAYESRLCYNFLGSYSIFNNFFLSCLPVFFFIILSIITAKWSEKWILLGSFWISWHMATSYRRKRWIKRKKYMLSIYLYIYFNVNTNKNTLKLEK